MALFGDFDTGFTVTELTRYNRSLSGLRSDYAGERVSVSAFAARTDTGLVQDELRGDGTAGLYRLSRAPIVIGSDKLRIEVRDRFEITRVVESRELSRFIDYDLDYERGTVFFKEPVQNRDHRAQPDLHRRRTTKCAPAAKTRPRPACASRPSSPTSASRSAPAPCTRARRRATPASPAPT